MSRGPVSPGASTPPWGALRGPGTRGDLCKCQRAAENILSHCRPAEKAQSPRKHLNEPLRRQHCSGASGAAASLGRLRPSLHPGGPALLWVRRPHCALLAPREALRLCLQLSGSTLAPGPQNQRNLLGASAGLGLGPGCPRTHTRSGTRGSRRSVPRVRRGALGRALCLEGGPGRSRRRALRDGGCEQRQAHRLGGGACSLPGTSALGHLQLRQDTQPRGRAGAQGVNAEAGPRPDDLAARARQGPTRARESGLGSPGAAGRPRGGWTALPWDTNGVSSAWLDVRPQRTLRSARHSLPCGAGARLASSPAARLSCA